MVFSVAMRHLLLSDIHGNAVALDAVLRDSRRRGWDRAIFLGDLVGYYTEPEEATRLLMSLEPRVCLLGNHDQTLLEMIDGRQLSGSEKQLVIEVIGRHAQALSSESIEFIRSFTEAAEGDSWQAVHGALRQRWGYVDRLQAAQENLPLLDRPICFLGHTHVPRVFAAITVADDDMWRTVTFRNGKGSYRIPPRARAFVNPGSVGQPRDGLPLASYAVYDDESSTIEVFRVEFDLRSVQRAVKEHGYPEALATRLALGR